MLVHGKRLAILAALVAAALFLGVSRGHNHAPPLEAALTSPGGIGALPSALPALVALPPDVPGVPQPLPAFAPASGDGSLAIVIAFCEERNPRTGLRQCPADPLNRSGNRAVTFTLNKLFPPGEPVQASFADIVPDPDSGWGIPVANGKTTLVCTDDATCDLSAAEADGTGLFGDQPQHVAVAITGGGSNEVLSVEACDFSGDCRSVMVFFIETILALFPLGPSSADSPHTVSFACQSTGMYTGLADPALEAPPSGFASPVVTWEEVYDFLYWQFPTRSGALRSPNSNLPLPDIPFYSCGGMTSGPTDDRVAFETDKGLFSIDDVADGAHTIAAGARPFGTLSIECDVGDSVVIHDHPGPVVKTNGFLPQPDVPATYCDVDFAPNGVVTYIFTGTGDVGVASITAQQSGLGGATVPRNINVTFTGAPAISLFLSGPDQMGLEGGKFSVAVVDSSFIPLGGHAIECTASPVEAGYLIIPPTGTTGGLLDPTPGQVEFRVVPTPSAVAQNVDLAVTCVLDSNRDVTATKVIKLVGKPVREAVDLVAGCNLVSFLPNYNQGEDLANVAADIAGGTPTLWFQSGATDFDLYDPESEERSTITTLQQEAGYICVEENTTWNRPAISQEIEEEGGLGLG